MAINVGRISEPSTRKELSNYSYYTFEGLSAASTSFLQDLDEERGASAWYVFDPSVTAYVPFEQDVSSLFTDSVDITAESVSIFSQNVQFLLHSTAVSYGYDSVENFISYYNSADPTKREEARSFLNWRDEILQRADLNVYGFTAAGITLPNLTEFRGQTGYSEFEVSPIQETFFGNENLGYQIIPNTDNVFVSWYNIDHTDNLYGIGVGEFINSGNISAIYSISATIDQTGLSSSWESEDFSVKVRLTGTANDYGVQTDYEYKLGSVGSVFSGFSGLKVRINCVGKYN